MSYYNPPPLSPDDTFPLWGFDHGGERIVFTRGRTVEEAQEYVGGVPVWELPINLANYYSTTHYGDWYRTPMWWLCERLGLDPRDYGHLPRHERLARLLGLLSDASGSDREA